MSLSISISLQAEWYVPSFSRGRPAENTKKKKILLTLKYNFVRYRKGNPGVRRLVKWIYYWIGPIGVFERRYSLVGNPKNPGNRVPSRDRLDLNEPIRGWPFSPGKAQLNGQIFCPWGKPNLLMNGLRYGIFITGRKDNFELSFLSLSSASLWLWIGFLIFIESTLSSCPPFFLTPCGLVFCLLLSEIAAVRLQTPTSIFYRPWIFFSTPNNGTITALFEINKV